MLFLLKVKLSLKYTELQPRRCTLQNKLSLKWHEQWLASNSDPVKSIKCLNKCFYSTTLVFKSLFINWAHCLINKSDLKHSERISCYKMNTCHIVPEYPSFTYSWESSSGTPATSATHERLTHGRTSKSGILRWCKKNTWTLMPWAGFKPKCLAIIWHKTVCASEHTATKVHISHNKKKMKELLLNLKCLLLHFLKYFKWGLITYKYYWKQSIVIYTLLNLWNFF
jgi:hypothetical protein